MLLAIFFVLFVSVGSAFAADLTSDVNSGNEILNSEDNGLVSINGSDVDGGLDVNSTSNAEISSVSVNANSSDSNVNNVSANVVKTDDAKTNSSSETITNLGATKYVTAKQIATAAKTFQSYIKSKKALPSSVKVGSYTVTAAQFSYLMAKAMQNIKAGKASTKIAIVSKNASSSTLTYLNYKASISVAVGIAKVATNYTKLPGTITYSGKKYCYKVYTYGFATAMAYYASNSKLPSTVLFTSSVFNGTPTPVPGKDNVTLTQVYNAATTVKNYVSSNKTLPSTVTVGSFNVSIAQFSYLMAKAIQNINTSKTSSVILLVNVTNSSTTYNTTVTATLAQFVANAKSVVSSGDSSNAVPAYVNISSKKVDFRTYTYGFAKILDFYKSNKRLPNSNVYNSSVFNSTPTPVPGKDNVTLAQVCAAATTVKNYVSSNKTLPSTITVGSFKVSIAQFSYLMAKAIENINNNKTSDVILLINVTNSSTTYNVNVTADLAQFVANAKSVVSASSTNKTAPAYVNVSSSKVDFRVYTYGFAKILDYYKSNNRLPNSNLYDSSVFNSTPTPTNATVTLTQICAAAVNVKNYVDANNALPNSVAVGSYNVSIAQFSYLMAKAIQNINTSKASSNITIINVTNGSSEYDVYVVATLAQFVANAKSVVNSATSNKSVPAYVSVSSSKVDFRVYTYGFAKILEFYKSNNRLPNSNVFDSGVFIIKPTPVPTNITIKKGINEYNTITNLTDYLKASGHCALNSAIKSLAESLTAGCKNDMEKATKIFNYVRDKIDYDFYSNSVKNASGTLSSKKANCCDQANLVVALCRASGIAARYSHGKNCTFPSSGLVTGHVWAQILVDGVWYAADATSSRNSLGVINNWNIKSFTLANQYASLPF